jgi:hypothetical protein
MASVANDDCQGNHMKPLLLLIGMALLVLGCESPMQRELARHRQLLAKLLQQHPTTLALDEALGATPARVAGPADAGEIASIWTNPLNSRDEVVEKMRRWPETRIYDKTSVVYLVYVDADGHMGDFTCLANLPSVSGGKD